MTSEPSRDSRNQERWAVIRALITDATRDTALWLQSASTEEQIHVLGVQTVLGDLSRIIERRIEGRALPGDEKEWSEKVDEVKSKLKEASAVRGRIVGETLGDLEARLPSVLTGARVTRDSNPKVRSTGIIPGQFEGIPQWQLTELMQRRLATAGRARVDENHTPESPDPILEAFGRNDTSVASERTHTGDKRKAAQGVESKSKNGALQPFTQTEEQHRKRLSGRVNSPSAARKMENYLESKGIGQTDFASTVGTTDRTLRAFRKTGKVRRDIFEAIAKHMGTTKEALLQE